MKTYTRRIFNTLEIRVRLLDILILLVAVDIQIFTSKCVLVYSVRYIDAMLCSKKLIVMILFSNELA